MGNVQPQPLVENYTIMDVMEKLKNNYNIQKEFSIITNNFTCSGKPIELVSHLKQQKKKKRHNRELNTQTKDYIS